MHSSSTAATRHGSVPSYLLAKPSPTRMALLGLGERHTYAELSQAALAVATHLLSLGLVPGERVLLAAPNSFFWVASYLGILKAGLVAVPVSPTLTGRELEQILTLTEARAAFVQAGVARSQPSLAALPLVTNVGPAVDGCARSVDFPALLGRPVRGYALPRIAPSSLAALLFTSGSTGQPRGVMISHANIVANTSSIVEYLQLTASDRMMTVLPFHYCFGLSLLHTHLRAGASLVLDNRFLYPEKVLDHMQEAQCTGFAGVPSHYQILLRKSSFAAREFPSLRHLQQAGGHLPPEMVRELQTAVPQAKVFVMYGQTEATARLSYLPPEKLARKPGSIGAGIPGVRLRVLLDGQPVQPGQTGEIVAEGANIARGYWRDAAATSEVFRDGCLHTGDLATVDAEGDIFIVGRMRDFLKCGGVRLSASALEEMLLGCEGVVEAAVVGVPDPLLGEAVQAYVVASGGAAVEPLLREHCRRHLPPVAQPRAICFLEALPKNSSGKPDKQRLRAIATELRTA